MGDGGAEVIVAAGLGISATLTTSYQFADTSVPAGQDRPPDTYSPSPSAWPP